MRQPSLFSAAARPAELADLSGLLCGCGQVVSFGQGRAARLSVVVEEQWRAAAIADAFTGRGLAPELGSSQEGRPLVRTPFLADLAPLATQWTAGAVKAVPAGLQLDGPKLRLWAVAAGRAGTARMPSYLLALDPHAPDTHVPLAAALAAAGLAATKLGDAAGQPVLRVTGTRRLLRLSDLVGDPPTGAPSGSWPV